MSAAVMLFQFLAAREEEDGSMDGDSGNLILGRHIGERFVILVGHDEVWVEVRDVWPGGCRLAVSAPRHIGIFRSEILGRHKAGPPQNDAGRAD